MEESSLMRSFHLHEKGAWAEAFQEKPHLSIWRSSGQNFLQQFKSIASQKKKNRKKRKEKKITKRANIVVNH